MDDAGEFISTYQNVAVVLSLFCFNVKLKGLEFEINLYNNCTYFYSFIASWDRFCYVLQPGFVLPVFSLDEYVRTKNHNNRSLYR